MSTIICLAHYCDTHGPTPLMVTEALPVGCTSCFAEEDSFGCRRPSTSSRSLNPQDGLAGMMGGASRHNSTSSDKESGMERPALQKQGSKNQAFFPSAIETPPGSPRVSALQTQNGRRDSSFRKTYDENDKKRAIPCENCALTLPKKTKEDGPGCNTLDNNGPILRTRKPYERVLTPNDEPSPPKSATSSDSENAFTTTNTKRANPLIRATTSSSNSSFGSATTHDHFHDYTSTHEPLSPSSFSIIRQSCLRTLSCETLPPSTQYTSAATSPTSPLVSSFTSGPLPATSTSGGPILFGDPLAGYTTAFIFRIPDPNARGRRRVYALMALSTHHERVAMKVFSFLAGAFRELAAWIQALAENELERTENGNSLSPRISEGRQSAFNNTPTSSFLQGRHRGGDGKFAGMNLRSRGLAEIVGLPDFFIELHTKFVRLLIELMIHLKDI